MSEVAAIPDYVLDALYQVSNGGIPDMGDFDNVIHELNWRGYSDVSAWLEDNVERFDEALKAI